MRKIALIFASMASLLLASCGKFEVENTATKDLAGNWMCTIFTNDGQTWSPYYTAEFVTYNTAANIGTEMWVNDNENFWGTLCKVDCSNSELTFGKEGTEYEDQYNNVKQKIWGGKVSVEAATAPGTPTKCDKIEFYIAFEDDNSPYESTYYVVGYRRTGFPEDDDNFIIDWELPAI